MQSWSEYTDADLQLLAAYQSGIDYLMDALKQEAAQ